MQRPRPWVIVPGIWNSGPEHWQTRWEAERAGDDPGTVVRIAPSSWSDPDPDDWSAAISRAVAGFDEPPVLIAHSLGVLAVAAWLRERSGGAGHGAVAGAFLVAPPDPRAPGFPPEAAGFPEPSARADHGVLAARADGAVLPVRAGGSVPARMVVSDDDPYCTADRATVFAAALGAEVLRVGALGHVNVASGLGVWPGGRSMLAAFERSLRDD